MIYPKNFIQALILVVLVILLLFAGILLSNFFSQDFEFNLFIGSFIVVIFIVCFLFLVNKKIPLNISVKFSLPDRKLILSTIILAVLLSLSISNPIYLLFSDFIIAENNPSISFIFSLILIAPLWEEYFFRGVIFGGLSENKSLQYSLLTSTFLFATFHFDPKLLIPTLLLGAICALLYYATKSLSYAIIFHITFNITSLCYTFFIRNYGLNKGYILILSILSFIVMLFLGFRIFKKFKKERFT